MNLDHLLDERSREVLRVQRILWVALTATVPMFVVAGVVARPPDAVPEQPLMPLLFAALGLGVLAVSVLVPRHQLALALRQLALPTREVAGAAESILPEAARPKVRVFENPTVALHAALLKSQPPFILSLALRDVLANFGLVLLFQGFSWLVAAPFFAAALVAILLGAPSPRRVAEMLEAVTGTKLAA